MNRILFVAWLLLLVTGCTSTRSETVQPQSGPSEAVRRPPTTPDEASQLTIREIRSKVPFPIFVPTDLPKDLSPAVRLRDEGTSRPLVDIDYRKTDGSKELHVLNGPAGCCLDADPRKAVGPVQIRGSITAYFLVNQPEFGGPILWWQQDGTYVALSGPRMNRDDLVKIANSMSATANP